MASQSNWLKWALAVLVVLLLLAGGWVYLLGRSTFTPPPLPQPNGYDQLLAAAEKVAPRTGFYDEMEPEELAAIVEQNKPALELARDALEQEIAMPIDWSRDPAVTPDRTAENRLSAMRKLSRAFLAEANYEVSQEEYEKALKDGIDMYRLGAKSYRGGLIVDLLVGTAVKGVALEQFRQVAIGNPAQYEMMLEHLQQLEELGEPAQDVIQRELDYIKSSTRGVQGLIIRMQTDSLMQGSIQAAKQAVRRVESQRRLLELHLAIRIYQQKNDTWPSKLADVTSLLRGEVPRDPFTEGDFVYRVEDGDYQLYSKGVNGRDDGGIGDETGLKEDMLYPLSPETEEELEDR